MPSLRSASPTGVVADAVGFSSKASAEPAGRHSGAELEQVDDPSRLAIGDQTDNHPVAVQIATAEACPDHDHTLAAAPHPNAAALLVRDALGTVAAGIPHNAAAGSADTGGARNRDFADRTGAHCQEAVGSSHDLARRHGHTAQGRGSAPARDFSASLTPPEPAATRRAPLGSDHNQRASDSHSDSRKSCDSKPQLVWPRRLADNGGLLA